MRRAESPFRHQPLPPGEPRLTAREGVRVLIHELQGRTINLRRVLESGVQPDHGHCRDVLGLITKDLNTTVYDPGLYNRYFLDKYGIKGRIAVYPDSLLLTDEVSVYRGRHHWPAGSVVQAFPWVDFSSLFAHNGISYGAPINTSRTGRRSNFYTVDVPLGDGVRRSEELILDWAEQWYGGIDKFVVTDQGYKLLTAFLAAIV